MNECVEIRGAHDRRVERAVRAVTMLREKFDWKQRVEVEVEEPEELDWDPRARRTQAGSEETSDAAVIKATRAHVCHGSTEASCFFMGPRWLIYPILSYPQFLEARGRSFSLLLPPSTDTVTHTINRPQSASTPDNN